MFYSAGYLKDGRYRSYEISFSDFLKSIYSTSDDTIQFGFRSYNKAYDYKFDRDRTLAEFKDYLNSTTSHNAKPKVWYGIAANRKLKEYFLYCVDTYDNPGIDLRYTRAYMEHKYFVGLCIKYLCDNKIINDTKTDSKKIDELYQDAVLIHTLGMKMNISKNYNTISKMAVLFDKIQDEEIKIINDIINMPESD